MVAENGQTNNIGGHLILKTRWREYLPIILDMLYKSSSVKDIIYPLSKLLNAQIDHRSIAHLFEHINETQMLSPDKKLLPPASYCRGAKKISGERLREIITIPIFSKYENTENLAVETEEIDTLMKHLRKNRTATITDLADLIERSPGYVKKLLATAEESGHEIGQMKDGTLYLHSPSMFQTSTWGHARTIEILPVSGTVSFGILSDPHFGSKVAMIEEINDFVDYLYNTLKIKTILVPGDCLDGFNVYADQLDEVDCWKMDDQVDLLIGNLPKYPGLKYYYILGNHDLSNTKKTGSSISKILDNERKDMVCLGSYRARVKVPDKNGVDIEMRHSGKGGRAYSMSYPLQQIVERGMTGGSKPHIFIAGHLHTAMYIPLLRNVHTFSAGCFQGETTLTVRYNIPVMVGGWACHIEYDKNHWIKDFHQRFHGYYLGLRGTYTGRKKIGIHRVRRIEGWTEE